MLQGIVVLSDGHVQGARQGRRAKDASGGEGQIDASCDRTRDQSGYSNCVRGIASQSMNS